MIRTIDVRSADDLVEPLSHIRRGSRLCITVGVPVVQVKRIAGIPGVGDSHAASRLVRDNVNTFFLRVAEKIEVADAAMTRDGEVWAAVYDRGALESIAESARLARCRLVCVAPRAELLPAALRGSTAWYRRRPLAWYPRRRRAMTRGMRAAMALTCAIMTTCSALASVAAPAVRYRHFVWANSFDAERSRSIVAAASRTGAETARVSRQLADILAFREGRSAIPVFLATLSEALPESAVVVSLRLDGREGSVTAIAPNVADLLAAFDAGTGVSAPRVAGALTSEVIAGVRFQRATIRFRRKPNGA